MKIKVLIISLALLFVFQISSYAQKQKKQPKQTLYAVLCGQTEVFDIGRGCTMSIQKMTSFLEELEGELKLDVEIITITGEEYTKERIVETIANLEPKSPENSVVMFYGTGHGFNYDGEVSRYAFLGAHPRRKNFSRAEFEEFGLSLEREVHEALLDKGARLTISLVEACNNLLNIPSPERYYHMSPEYIPMTVNTPEQLAELFLRAEGDIISTSSEIGQFSWTDPKEGGIWTNQFLKAFDECVTGDVVADWVDIFDKTKAYTIAAAQAEANVDQVPDSDVDIINTPVGLIEEGEKIPSKKELKKQEKQLAKKGYIVPRIRIIEN